MGDRKKGGRASIRSNARVDNQSRALDDEVTANIDLGDTILTSPHIMSEGSSRQRTIQNNVVECHDSKVGRRVGHPKRRRQHKRRRPPRLIGIISVVLLLIIAFAIIHIIVPTRTRKKDGSSSTRLRRNLNPEEEVSTPFVPPPSSSLPRPNSIKEEKLRTMSMEEYELSVLRGASELNWFPQSIGEDTDGTSDDWETIEHPAAEVIRVFRAGNNGNDMKRQSSLLHKSKKTVTVKELAIVLARRKNDKRPIEEVKEEETEISGSSSDDGDGLMRVPKFWDPLPFRNIADERQRRQNSGGAATGSNSASFNDTATDSSSGVRRYLGNYGSRLMTPNEAKSIGSRIPNKNGVTIEDGHGSGGDDDNLLDTIFVAISSYRDWQCSRTVESIFSRATHPERIRVGVVDQVRIDVDAPCSIPPLGPCDEYPNQMTCHHRHQIDYLTVDAGLSVGPVFARHLGHRLYRGEYFAIQSDAHVDYVLGWDVDIIDQWRTAKNEMAILSAYLSGIEDHMNITTGVRTSSSRPIMCMSDFEGGEGGRHLRHGQQPEGVPYSKIHISCFFVCACV